MEVAFHSGLARAHTSQTSPTASQHSRLHSNGGPSLMSHQSYQSQYSSYSHNSARDTQSTQATNTTTLFGGATPGFSSSTPVNGGAPQEAVNVLNKRADKDTSLFQRCLQLQLRLRAIPGFERWMVEEEHKAASDDDPVTLIWRTLRRGYPLMDIYNALGPKQRLRIDEVSESKNSGKKATYKFLQACISELKFPSEECFIIADLYGDDTTGFVKVRWLCRR
jgi:cell division control protein 24